jgi:glycosyl transferase family 87
VSSFPVLRSAFGIRLLFDFAFVRAALWVVLGIAAALRLAQFLAFATTDHWGYDFAAYFGAGVDVLAGRSPYEPFQIAGAYSPQSGGLFIYPPAFAAVMAPLAAAFDDYRVATWLWSAIGAAILAVVVLAVSRREALMERRDQGLVLLAAFAFAPVIGELVMGNVHLLILGLLAAAWIAVQRGTDRGEIVAGGLIGIATLIKIFPGVLILWLLLTGRVRGAIAALIAMVALAVVSLPVVGLEAWLQYPAVLFNLGAPDNTRDILAPTVWLSTVMPPLLARLVVTGACLGAVVWTTLRRSERVSFGVAVAASILIAPAVYQHYLALFVLPMLLAVRSVPLAWLAVAYVFMSGGELEMLGNLVWVVNRALPTAGALMVLAGLMVFDGRSSPATGERPA